MHNPFGVYRANAATRPHPHHTTWCSARVSGSSIDLVLDVDIIIAAYAAIKTHRISAVSGSRTRALRRRDTASRSRRRRGSGAPAGDGDQAHRLRADDRRDRRSRFRTTWRSRSKPTRSRRSARPIRSSRPMPTPRSTTGAAKALSPGLDQLSRPPRGDARARLQRGLRIPQLRAPDRPTRQPSSGRRGTLMVTVGALEALRTGTTTIVENAGGISRSAAALAQTGLRCVFAESIRDSENVAGPMSPEGLAKSETPKFSAEAARRRTAAHRRTCSARGTARSRDASPCSRPPRSPRRRRPNCCRRSAPLPRNTISATRSTCRRAVAEVEFMVRHHRPQSAGVSRAGTASSVRGCSRRTAATSTTATSRCSARSGTIVSHQAAMAANRGVIPPIAKPARGRLPDRQRHRQQHQRPVRGDACRAADRTDLGATIRFPESGRSRKTCSKTRRSAERERRVRNAGRLARGREEGRHSRRGHTAGPPRPGRAHRLGVDPQRSAVRHRVGRWSTASSSCATARS